MIIRKLKNINRESMCYECKLRQIDFKTYGEVDFYKIQPGKIDIRERTKLILCETCFKKLKEVLK